MRRLLIFLIALCVAGTAYANDFMYFKKKAAGGGAAPAYGGEVMRWAETASGATTVITLTSGISQNNRSVVFVYCDSGTQTITSVADSRGNTYTIHQDQFNSPRRIAIASANVATALVTNDTITVTWGSPAYTYRGGAIFYATNVSSTGQPDQSAKAGTYGTTVAISADTTATNTTLIGMVRSTTTYTYGSSSWDVIGAAQDIDNNRNYYVKKDITSSGSQDPGGSWNTDVSWSGVWAAFK